MQEINILNKERYLDENFPFDEVPKLTDKKRCIHCDTGFIVGDYKVFKDKGATNLFVAQMHPTVTVQ